MNEEEKEAIYELEDIKFEEGINKKIDIVLNLIEKQQKKLKKLNDKLKEERDFSKSALETLKDCVHKDRIRKIIEEYNKKCDECNFNKSGICKELKAYNCCSIQSVLEILKILIGETK